MQYEDVYPSLSLLALILRATFSAERRYWWKKYSPKSLAFYTYLCRFRTEKMEKYFYFRDSLLNLVLLPPLHGLDGFGKNLIQLHAQHPGSFLNYLPVDAGGKALLLPLLFQGLDI